jgi:hypothetical protein
MKFILTLPYKFVAIVLVGTALALILVLAVGVPANIVAMLQP